MLVVVLLWETLHRPLNHIAQMLTGKTRYLGYLNKNKHLDVVLKSKVEEDSSARL